MLTGDLSGDEQRPEGRRLPSSVVMARVVFLLMVNLEKRMRSPQARWEELMGLVELLGDDPGDEVVGRSGC